MFSYCIAMHYQTSASYHHKTRKESKNEQNVDGSVNQSAWHRQRSLISIRSCSKLCEGMKYNPILRQKERERETTLGDYVERS